MVAQSRHCPLSKRKLRWLAVALVAGPIATAASAQPADLPIAPATTTDFPPGVAVANTAAGQVYVDAKGRTLYGLDMRTLLRWGADPASYCTGKCAEWQPLLAPAEARANIAYPQGSGERLRKSIESGTPPPRGAGTPDETKPDGFYDDPLKAPDWTVIAGPAGPQWVYKGWHMVYVRKGDNRGSTRFDGADGQTWNTLKYRPPVPTVSAPAGIRPVLAGDGYVLADKDGHALFTGPCAAPCPAWRPLTGGMANKGFGAWQVSILGDRPQWTYRGQPVFVSQEPEPGKVPAPGKALRP